MNSIFLIAIIVSTVAYTLQGVCIVKYSRKYNGLTATVYRNLSLGISLLPLLFFVGGREFITVLPYLPLIFLSSLLAAIASVLGQDSLQDLPVGIHSTIGSGVKIIFSFCLGLLFFAEKITLPQIILIFFLLLVNILLNYHKKDFSHLSNKSLRGIILTVISGLFITLSLYLTTRSSRAINPFLVGYIWEIGIGIFALLYAIILSFLSCKNFLPQKYNCQLPKISLQEFGKILLISSPTLLGTGGFFYAVAHGPFAVASAISSAGGVTLSVIFAHFFYRENLNKKQIFFIFLSIILIASFILIS